MIVSKPAGNGGAKITDSNAAAAAAINANPHHNLELQLLTTTSSSSRLDVSVSSKIDDADHSTQLQLSIGSSDFTTHNEAAENEKQSFNGARAMREEAREHLRAAMEEKAYAKEARQQAKKQIELAEQEFANAKKIRQQAQADLNKAQALREHAVRQINSTLLQITCHACKHQFQGSAIVSRPDNALALSYISSALMETRDLDGRK
nr:protein SHOOT GRAVITROPISM 5-like [Ipomoea trifida]